MTNRTTKNNNAHSGKKLRIDLKIDIIVDVRFVFLSLSKKPRNDGKKTRIFFEIENKIEALAIN